jgi:hypothetical protein
MRMGLLHYRAVIASVAMLATCAMSSGAASSSDVLRSKSDIKGVSLVSLRAIPRSPENGSLDEYCEGYRARKLTAVGRQVAKLGWIVTSEAPLGRYQVVTFVSGFTPSTSAMCLARNANIGIFDGASLVALAYTPRSTDTPLGKVESLEGGALLIWSDPPGWPVGELHEQNNSLRLTPIAPERTFCRGRAVVPNVYGKQIEAARKILIAHGWRPRRPAQRPPFEVDFIVAQLAKSGVIEAEDCSGTGVGYCGFAYDGPAGVLGVTTAGDDHSVVSYGVACSAR